MSNAIATETLQNKPALVVETSRGPSLADTRITVYAIMDYLVDDLSRERIKGDFLISDEQLDAVIEYVAAHRDEVERDYQAILRRSEAAQKESDRLWRERSRFPPDMPWAEKNILLRQELERRLQAEQTNNGNNDPA